MVTESTHTAYQACEAVVMAHLVTESTHMAYQACEAGAMAHIRTLVGQNGARVVTQKEYLGSK